MKMNKTLKGLTTGASLAAFMALGGAASAANLLGSEQLDSGYTHTGDEKPDPKKKKGDKDKHCAAKKGDKDKHCGGEEGKGDKEGSCGEHGCGGKRG